MSSSARPIARFFSLALFSALFFSFIGTAQAWETLTRDSRGGYVVVNERGWSRAPSDVARARAQLDYERRQGVRQVYSYDGNGNTIIRKVQPHQTYRDAVRQGHNTYPACSRYDRRRYPWN